MATQVENVIPAQDEMKYLVLADRGVPYLLARVRWPDVAQAVSAASPHWLEDPGLFDLPYAPNAVAVSFAQAASVAAGWGRQLEAEPASDARPYIRRMPSKWSDLSPSERRAWGIEFVGRRPIWSRWIRRKPLAATAPGNVAVERRGYVRVGLAGRAHIRCADETISAELVDLSERGARCQLLELPKLVERGAALTGPFLVEVKAQSSRVCLDVASTITWQRITRAGTQFGVAFAELAEDETDGIQRFLATANRN